MITCLVDYIIIIKYDVLLSDKRFYLNYFVCKPTYLLHAYFFYYYYATTSITRQSICKPDARWPHLHYLILIKKNKLLVPL